MIDDLDNQKRQLNEGRADAHRINLLPGLHPLIARNMWDAVIQACTEMKQQGWRPADVAVQDGMALLGDLRKVFRNQANHYARRARS